MPAIVYFHGGGHVIGGLDTHDFVARNLCGGTGAMVASVDYRMGPEHKFPAAVNDCFAALRWVHANAASLGADPDRIGVHGDSAAATSRPSPHCSPAMPAGRSCCCNRSSTRSPITVSLVTATTNTPAATAF
jgi:carboxylesterase type B